MSGFRTLDDLDVAGRRVLVRADLNLPVKDGRVTDATRLDRLLPTIEYLADRGASVVVLSHFGRPKGKRDPAYSLSQIAERVGEAVGEKLGRRFVFVADCVGPEARRAVEALERGDVALLENLRFHPGEEANDPAFARSLAELGELYVNDAFSSAHRAHASVEALARLLPAAAGLGMATELEALARALERPERPLAALIGGAKVSTKLDVLGNLIERVDALIIGGGMANTFLHAQGVKVGRSLCEADLAETAREIMAHAERSDTEILLPIDVVVAAALEANARAETVPADEVPDDAMILDIGPRTSEGLIERLKACRTLVWNGPLGAFETPPFDKATVVVAKAAAGLTRDERLVSVAGGGDTVAALAHAGVSLDFTYVSTAGGAFLEWLEGKPLPGVAALVAAVGGA